MAQRTAKGKTSSVNRAAPAEVTTAVATYCGDLKDWPRSWMGLEKDLPPGEQLLTCLRPFLEQLATTKLTSKTIRRHIDNLWLLGGEIIRDLHEDPSLRKVAMEKLLRRVVHEDGGPLLRHGTEDEQRSFDSTCRKLYQFLNQN
jgi:hypothetical protein